MIKLRIKARAVIMAATLAVGSALGLTVATAAPAYAVSCSYSGYIWNSSNSSHYLDDYGGGSGTYVHTYTFSGSNNQYWCLEAAAEGGYYFHPYNNLGLCLDAHTYNSGQPIWVYSCNGTLPQRWCWSGWNGYIVTEGNFNMALRDNGLYRITSINNGGNNTWSMNSIVNTC